LIQSGVTVWLFEINTEKGHGSPSKNRTTKTPHLSGKFQGMGEAGGGVPGNSPCNTQLAGAGQASPPAFAAPYLQSLSRTLFVFCFWRDPHGLSHPFQRAKLLQSVLLRIALPRLAQIREAGVHLCPRNLTCVPSDIKAEFSLRCLRATPFALTENGVSLIVRGHPSCLHRGLGEKPSPSGEDFSLVSCAGI
jgi:hypothetical protein